MFSMVAVRQAALRLEIAERLVRDQLDQAVAEHNAGSHQLVPPDRWERQATVERTVAAYERAADELLNALNEDPAES